MKKQELNFSKIVLLLLIILSYTNLNGQDFKKISTGIGLESKVQNQKPIYGIGFFYIHYDYSIGMKFFFGSNFQKPQNTFSYEIIENNIRVNSKLEKRFDISFITPLINSLNFYIGITFHLEYNGDYLKLWDKSDYIKYWDQSEIDFYPNTDRYNIKYHLNFGLLYDIVESNLFTQMGLTLGKYNTFDFGIGIRF